MAETCEVGPLQYKNCVVDVIEQKSVAGEDGLIGTDFLADFLMELDFERHKVRLTPQPKRQPDPQGRDRTLSPGFAPVLRFGHHLMIPTRVNGSEEELFLIDTGASLSNIDGTFARSVTKVHGNDSMKVCGISGAVKKVYEADKADIQFAGFEHYRPAGTRDVSAYDRLSQRIGKAGLYPPLNLDQLPPWRSTSALLTTYARVRYLAPAARARRGSAAASSL